VGSDQEVDVITDSTQHHTTGKARMMEKEEEKNFTRSSMVNTRKSRRRLSCVVGFLKREGKKKKFQEDEGIFLFFNSYTVCKYMN
jgi:hypothetical protein